MNKPLISLSNISIQYRLPLIISTLLFILILVFTGASYYGLSQSNIKLSNERLTTLGEQFESLVQGNVQKLLSAALEKANSREVKKFILTGEIGSKEKLISYLNEKESPHDSLLLLVQILDKEMKPLLTTTRRTNTQLNLSNIFEKKQNVPYALIGNFKDVNDSVFWPIISTVVNKGEIIGYLLKWRLLKSSPENLKNYSDILDPNTYFYFANQDGTVWNNLLTPVDSPPINIDSNQNIFEYQDKNGDEVFASLVHIDNTPWVIAIVRTKESILAPATRFLEIISAIGVVLLVAGVFLGWVMSKNITTPLSKLNSAVSEISKGDYHTLVNVDSNDELGKLAESFNIMAIKIRNSQSDLEKRIEEKEVLLKEIHHRVKNNLQVISSLINLQSNTIHDNKSLDIFRDSQNRIRSMALIHEKLYQSPNLMKINLEEYVNDLVDSLYSSYNLNPDILSMNIQINNISFSIDKAISIGLIINELISNALKHAFTDNSVKKGEVQVLVNKDESNNYCLIVKDNGKGLPEGYDYYNPHTLGLRLVDSLVKQLEGNLEIRNKVGTEFKITFQSADGFNKPA